MQTSTSSSNSILNSLDKRVKCMFFGLALMTSVLVGAGCAKQKVIVPDLTKQDLDQAQKTLTGMQLKSSVNGPQGTGAYVTQQIPAAGQEVEANSSVTLTVDVPVAVPALVGSNITDAVNTLQSLGLKVAFQKKSTLNPFAKTKVEAQNPPPNTLVHKDSLVLMNISGPGDIDALLSVVAKEPAYQNLKPQYKTFLDAFLNNPGVARSMEPQDAAPAAASTPSAPDKK